MGGSGGVGCAVGWAKMRCLETMQICSNSFGSNEYTWTVSQDLAILQEELEALYANIDDPANAERIREIESQVEALEDKQAAAEADFREIVLLGPPTIPLGVHRLSNKNAKEPGTTPCTAS